MSEVEKITQVLTEIGMPKDEFDISTYKTSSRKNGEEEGYEVRFRQKGNKKAIKILTDHGYKRDRLYRNDDGSPDVFSTTMFGNVYSYNIVMVAMRKAINQPIYL